MRRGAAAGRLRVLLIALAVGTAGVAVALGAPPRLPIVSLSTEYAPRHKGGIDLPTGLYTRENDDLVVAGSPALVLRRTYLSRYRSSQQFGVGALHPGEEYLYSDGNPDERISLILARGTRIHFDRAGTSASGAFRYVHERASAPWQDAELSWAGTHWMLRTRDGREGAFQRCNLRLNAGSCAIVRWRDADGGVVHYRRNGEGALLRMDDGADRWIAFEYDAQRRITRAHASTGQEVRYEYDSGGRLVRAASSDGAVRRYTYTDLDELATIEEPGASIENVYENGRVVRQLNRYPDCPPFVFDFAYRLEDGKVAATRTTRSDGSWTEYTWGPHRRPLTEVQGFSGFQPAVFTHERHAVTGALQAVRLACPGRDGQLAEHRRAATESDEEQVKGRMLRAHCYLVAPVPDDSQPGDSPTPAIRRVD